MSLSAREQHALDSIETALTGSDPDLAVLLATFGRLTSGEEMPGREKILGTRWWYRPRAGAGRRGMRRCAWSRALEPGAPRVAAAGLAAYRAAALDRGVGRADRAGASDQSRLSADVPGRLGGGVRPAGSRARRGTAQPRDGTALADGTARAGRAADRGGAPLTWPNGPPEG